MEGAKRKIHRLKSLSRRRDRSGGSDDHDAPPVFRFSVSDADADVSDSNTDANGRESRGRTAVAAQLAHVENGMVPARRVLPKSFVLKKKGILEALALEEGEYVDNSPKGSVDAGVRGVIALVNGAGGESGEEGGWVTTSSCAGRVSVFVEGGGGQREGVEGEGEDKEEHDDLPETDSVPVPNGEGDVDPDEQTMQQATIKTGPGGKGGGKWLYVSHEPVPSHDPVVNTEEGNYYTKLFGLEAQSSTILPRSTQASSPPRLIHLSFSPLILHVLCATLQHARPLLAAAINAGFRESGVQSLKALDDEDAGVMTGIRTAGLVFESVIGVVVEDENGQDRYQSVVSEEYLKMCVGVVNGRFEWNERRKDRLIAEVRKTVEGMGKEEEEGKEERRVRKREEGLKRQAEVRNGDGGNEMEKEKDGVDALGDGLEALEVR